MMYPSYELQPVSHVWSGCRSRDASSHGHHDIHSQERAPRWLLANHSFVMADLVSVSFSLTSRPQAAIPSLPTWSGQLASHVFYAVAHRMPDDGHQ